MLAVITRNSVEVRAVGPVPFAAVVFFAVAAVVVMEHLL
jgi:hypothetical protein